MLEEELGRMAPDLGVIEEWKRKDASYTQRLADLETATAARNEVLIQSGMSYLVVASWKSRRLLCALSSTLPALKSGSRAGGSLPEDHSA